MHIISLFEGVFRKPSVCFSSKVFRNHFSPVNYPTGQTVPIQGTFANNTSAIAAPCGLVGIWSSNLFVVLTYFLLKVWHTRIGNLNSVPVNNLA